MHGEDGHGLKLEKVGPTFLSLNANSGKNHHNELSWFIKCSLMRIASYQLHSSPGAYVGKSTKDSNDFSTELA